MPEKVSARPAEESNLHEVEKTVQQTEEALQQAEDEVLHVIELIESWDGQPGAKKVIVGTTITGAAIGWLVADQNAKEVIQSVVTGGVAGAEIGNAINTTAATITTIGIMIVLW
jgi:beta-phosphoglucomutase-like phosphatase (HAD superfamily)